MSRKTDSPCSQVDPSLRPLWLPALLFPSEPRSFPGRRAVKIALRALHVMTSGVAVGSYLFAVPDPLRSQWLIAASASGVAMLLVDLHESGAFLLQVRGLVVLVKIVLLGLLPLGGPAQGWILAGLVVFSVLSSHASSRVRYQIVFARGRVKGAETKG
jgi:hypothetical protein